MRSYELITAQVVRAEIGGRDQQYPVSAGSVFPGYRCETPGYVMVKVTTPVGIIDKAVPNDSVRVV